MKSLIIGHGEIGNALFEVLSETYPETHIRDFIEDKDYVKGEEFELIHICFPYSGKFEEYVKKYRTMFKARYVVVHSTVPVGTCERLGAVHSPVVGLHPHLEKSLYTFTKFLGGINARFVADYFRKAGMKVYLTDKSETTELMKIASTSYYALMIEYTKEIKRLSWKHEIPFEMWSIWTDNYNKGYQEMGYPEFTRPNLVPIMKPQGGHCTISNLGFLESEFAEIIKRQNIKNG